MNAKLGQSGLRNRLRHCGLSLMEEVIVVAAIALLIAISLPAVRSFIRSIEAQGSSKAMINAALAAARATAAQQQRYAGIRFQCKYQPDGKGCQYMIPIVQDPEIMAYGFRAVEGLQPIKLPDSVGVMDLKIVTNRNIIDPVGSIDVPLDDSLINEERELTDTTTFSIIFSPGGKLVIHGIRVRNKDGKTNNDSEDDIFNTKTNVENAIGMFFQDDYFGGSNPDLGLGPEASRRSFIIYDRDIFGKVDTGKRCSDYLDNVEEIYINPYTGTIIDR